MILCLETLLSSKDLKFFLKKNNEKKVKCVFDTGNRASISKNLYKEILLLKNLIGHVHIKDKNKKRENVILGTGLVNFNDIFKAIKKIGYKNKFTFETTRGANPIETAKYNINFCNFFIKNNNYK